MRNVLPIPPGTAVRIGTYSYNKSKQLDDALNEVLNVKRNFQCWTNRIARMLTTVGEP
jgi:hypothetical protein